MNHPVKYEVRFMNGSKYWFVTTRLNTEQCIELMKAKYFGVINDKWVLTKTELGISTVVFSSYKDRRLKVI